jgi:hypothetical protein
VLVDLAGDGVVTGVVIEVIEVAVEGRCSAVVLREVLAEAVRAAPRAVLVVLRVASVVLPAVLAGLRVASVVLRAEAVLGVAAAAVIGAVDLVR